MIFVTLIALGALVGVALARAWRRTAVDREAAARGGPGGSFVGGGVSIAIRDVQVWVFDPISLIAGALGAAGFALAVGHLSRRRDRTDGGAARR